MANKEWVVFVSEALGFEDCFIVEGPSSGGVLALLWRKKEMGPPKLETLHGFMVLDVGYEGAVFSQEWLQMSHRCLRIDNQNLCPLCSNPGESIYHALIDCSFVKEVWVISVLVSRGNRNGSICDWLQEIFTKFDKSTWHCIAAIVWNLWIHRNEVVWNSKRKQPRQIVDGAVTYLQRWLIAQQTNPPSPDNNEVFNHNLAKWKKPKSGSLKCNVDASTFNQQGMIGAGYVLRNTEGALLGARITSFVQSDLNLKLAEALSFREALSWTKA
ncbi:hypothetical protein RCOM_0596960 [Ricinus communis]|uniref:Reverse transcriptase zinc-binding domain-containing protein n=1 Tax=Ricinus communis TaxID=3988 RepID=B9SIZ2_RICCO|nr:hypothetical protein RCOM_0596960 [Ricinus communis]